MCVVSSLQLDFSHDINTDDVTLQSRGRLRNMVVLNEDSGIKVSATNFEDFRLFRLSPFFYTHDVLTEAALQGQRHLGCS